MQHTSNRRNTWFLCPSCTTYSMCTCSTHCSHIVSQLEKERRKNHLSRPKNVTVNIRYLCCRTVNTAFEWLSSFLYYYRKSSVTIRLIWAFGIEISMHESTSKRQIECNSNHETLWTHENAVLNVYYLMATCTQKDGLNNARSISTCFLAIENVLMGDKNLIQAKLSLKSMQPNGKQYCFVDLPLDRSHFLRTQQIRSSYIWNVAFLRIEWNQKCFSQCFVQLWTRKKRSTKFDFMDCLRSIVVLLRKVTGNLERKSFHFNTEHFTLETNAVKIGNLPKLCSLNCICIQLPWFDWGFCVLQSMLMRSYLQSQLGICSLCTFHYSHWRHSQPNCINKWIALIYTHKKYTF